MINAIETIGTPSGGTNFGDALQAANAYFLTHDTSLQQHIILLSDGEPTVSNTSQSPGERAINKAVEAKTNGI